MNDAVTSPAPGPTRAAVVIGGGPAGLMAAETLLDAGFAVDLYDSMPSLGRKFLMAGKSGLNISNAEPLDALLDRYGPAGPRLEAAIRTFGPAEIVAFAAGLDIETFIGSSGRIFPTGFKAAPLLRGWLRRLRSRGLKIHVRHRWRGFSPDGALSFATPDAPLTVGRPAAVVLALGGASWPALGSDGAWRSLLAARGIATHDFAATNCGFDVAWSDIFRERFAGQPVKPVAVRFGDHEIRGEFVVTATGIEGGAIYPLAAPARRALDEGRPAVLRLDLMPGRDEASLLAALSKPQGRHSLTDHLRRCLGLSGVRAGLLREGAAPSDLATPLAIARRLKSLPLPLARARPMAEAISTEGGVALQALDDNWMLKDLPGVFCAGEMVDWDAPTGGYLLTACLALGRAAGQGAARWLDGH